MRSLLEEIELGVRTQRHNVDAHRVCERAAETVYGLVCGGRIHVDFVAGPLRVERRHERPAAPAHPASGVRRRVQSVHAGRQCFRFWRPIAVRRVAHAHRAVRELPGPAVIRGCCCTLNIKLFSTFFAKIPNLE